MSATQKQPPTQKPKQVKVKDSDIDEYEWRTGKKRTAEAKKVFIQLDDKPSKDDICIGEMRSPTVADMVVKSHNGWFE